jgi:hypothetical protein
VTRLGAKREDQAPGREEDQVPDRKTARLYAWAALIGALATLVSALAGWIPT